MRASHQITMWYHLWFHLSLIVQLYQEQPSEDAKYWYNEYVSSECLRMGFTGGTKLPNSWGSDTTQLINDMQSDDQPLVRPLSLSPPYLSNL